MVEKHVLSVEDEEEEQEEEEEGEEMAGAVIGVFAIEKDE